MKSIETMKFIIILMLSFMLLSLAACQRSMLKTVPKVDPYQDYSILDTPINKSIVGWFWIQNRPVNPGYEPEVDVFKSYDQVSYGETSEFNIDIQGEVAQVLSTKLGLRQLSSEISNFSNVKVIQLRTFRDSLIQKDQPFVHSALVIGGVEISSTEELSGSAEIQLEANLKGIAEDSTFGLSGSGSKRKIGFGKDLIVAVKIAEFGEAKDVAEEEIQFKRSEIRPTHKELEGYSILFEQLYNPDVGDAYAYCLEIVVTDEFRKVNTQPLKSKSLYCPRSVEFKHEKPERTYYRSNAYEDNRSRKRNLIAFSENEKIVFIFLHIQNITVDFTEEENDLFLDDVEGKVKLVRREFELKPVRL